MSKKSIFTLFSLLVALVVAFAAAMPAQADAHAPDKQAAKYEIDFMMDMIDHHMMAIMEAEICLENAVHEELLNMCQNIMVTQHHEMEMMQTWLEDWYGISYEPEMDPGMMKQLEKLAALEGAEFEIEFMENMIKHHRGAVKEGQKCTERAYHPELVSMCEDIIVTQTQEIMMMQAWLCEWYDICKG